MIQLAIALIVLSVCLILKWQYSYWTRRKIEGPAPLPFFGNLYDYFIMKRHFGDIYDDIYKSYPKASYVGIYKFNTPAILVRDLDIVRDVLSAKFNHFHNNDFRVDHRMDPLWAENPFIKRDDNWSQSRQHMVSLLSPKMLMTTLPTAVKSCDKLLDYLKYATSANAEFDAKELMSKFVIEHLAACNFGVDADAFTNPDSEWLTRIQAIYQPSAMNMIKVITASFMPSFRMISPVGFVPRKTQKWMRKIVIEIIAERSLETTTNRNDFFDILLQRKKEEGLTNIQVAGQALTLLAEGFETSTLLMTYALYEIAVNARIQTKLQSEIDKFTKRQNGSIIVPELQDLPYFHRFFLETLRLHTPVMAIARVCTRKGGFELPPQFPDAQKGVTVDSGTPIILPIYSIQRDSTNYPESHVFDPDRFDENRVSALHKYSFLAFGEGPRICAGASFGLFLAKMAVATILKNYNVSLSPKTVEPLSILPTGFYLNAPGGVWICLKKR